MSELHPCEYCGTMLDENDEVESNIAACGPRMAHYASQCREYVYAAKESYKLEAMRLGAELATCRTMFDVTRHRVCDALGMEHGKSWSSIEGMIARLRTRLALQVVKAR